MTRKKKRKKGNVSRETFDEFLADVGMLETCVQQAMQEIVTDQLAAAREAKK